MANLLPGAAKKKRGVRNSALVVTSSGLSIYCAFETEAIVADGCSRVSRVTLPDFGVE